MLYLLEKHRDFVKEKETAVKEKQEAQLIIQDVRRSNDALAPEVRNLSVQFATECETLRFAISKNAQVINEEIVSINTD